MLSSPQNTRMARYLSSGKILSWPQAKVLQQIPLLYISRIFWHVLIFQGNLPSFGEPFVKETYLFSKNLSPKLTSYVRTPASCNVHSGEITANASSCVFEDNFPARKMNNSLLLKNTPRAGAGTALHL
jgi:hypothetical protein